MLIPIAWSKREREATEVMQAISDAQEALRAAGVKCDTDNSTKLTPGQKYRHWEEKGIYYFIIIIIHVYMLYRDLQYTSIY